MAAIGPEIPAHLLSAAASPEEQSKSTTLRSVTPDHPTEATEADPGDSNPSGDEDYLPELPPHLRDKAKASSSASAPRIPLSSRVLGPSLPSGLAPPSDDDESDSEIGPQPQFNPFGPQTGTQVDGIAQFRELEEKRRLNVEEAARPKALKRDEWMLVPPSASEVLGNIDPTRLKARTFGKSTDRDPSKLDNTLWTETPQQRQQRIADEVSGKKRRAVNAEEELASPEELSDIRKRQKLDNDIRKGVEAHTRTHRGESLVESHVKSSKGVADPKSHLVWDHGRDMSIGGRLMDDSQRAKLVRDAKGLGDRFGTGKSGGFL